MAQKTQPIAHPACDDMQDVRRPSEYGISTDSITWPSERRYASFLVPSLLTCFAATCVPMRPPPPWFREPCARGAF